MPHTEGTCGRGHVHNGQQPDLAPMPPRPARTQPKPSTAPESWGPRPPQRDQGDRPVVGTGGGFSKSSRHKGGRAAFQ